MEIKQKRINLIIIFFLFFNPITFPSEANSPHFFTLTLKMRNLDPYADIAILFSNQLQEIGIGVDVQLLSWTDYVQEMLVYKDYDIFHLSLTGGGEDPNFSLLYSENGSLNFFNYHSQFDYNSSLRMGANEWFIQEGREMFPAFSQERINHYHQWQEYLMKDINPMINAYAPQDFISYWNGLRGYNYKDELVQSWGKLNWLFTHPNMSSSSELVISSYDSINQLNPLFLTNEIDRLVSSTIMESLIRIDGDNSVWPHLAKDYEHLNQTHLRIYLREGIYWQNDSENIFTKELFDAQDVFFTFYCWQNLVEDNQQFDWIKDMQIIDDYTIDFFIDANSTTPGNQYTPTYLSSLEALILPEHYLNQTQLGDGKTPDTSHSSWLTFREHCFGTGILQFNDYIPAEELQLALFPDCWLLNTSVEKTNMDYLKRFGSNWLFDSLKIKIYTGYTNAFQNYLWGNIDMLDITGRKDNRTYLEAHTDFSVQSKYRNQMTIFGYNLDNSRPWVASSDPCPNDPTITKGLAIRKAISYAINRSALLQYLDEIEWAIHDYPIYPNMGVWLNQDIIRYNFDLEKARFYLEQAGFNFSTTTQNSKYIIFPGIFLSTIATLISRLEKSRK